MFRQSDRLERYAEAAERLKASGRLYPCFESEEELNAKREMRAKRHLPPIYDRAMLKLTPEQRAAAEAGGKKPYWRFLLSGVQAEWDDLVLGRRQVKLSAVSDPVLIRADGTPLYTFTSVVDDLDENITHIVRGEDHVTNTGLQLDIFEALAPGGGGRASRILPLLVDEDGGKLSKRTGSLSLRSLRGDGIEPAALAGYLAALGTSKDPVAAMPDELAQDYDLSPSVARRGAVRWAAVGGAQSPAAADSAVRGGAGPAAAGGDARVLDGGARQPRSAERGAGMVGRGGRVDRAAADRG